jgi:hypothetical protein
MGAEMLKSYHIPDTCTRINYGHVADAIHLNYKIFLEEIWTIKLYSIYNVKDK